MANGIGAEALLQVLGRGFQGFVQGRQQKALQLERQKKEEQERKKFEKQQRLSEAKFMSDIFRNVAGLEDTDRNQVLNQIFQQAGLSSADRDFSPTPFSFSPEDSQLSALEQAELEERQARTALSQARRMKLQDQSSSQDIPLEQMNTNQLLNVLRETGEIISREGLDAQQEDSLLQFSERAAELLEKKSGKNVDRKEKLRRKLRRMGISIPEQQAARGPSSDQTDRSEDQDIIRFLRSNNALVTPANIEAVRRQLSGSR